MKADLLDVADAPAEPQALARVEAEPVTMFERLATDPSVSVEKLERLIAMKERVDANDARAAFNAAFARMQPELPEIGERGQISVKGSLRSTYAKLEDIQAETKPILKQFGFAMRHRTEWPAEKPGIIRIVGILSHEQGHSEESTFEATMDRSDYRTDIQSMGSTVSYGRRYTTLDLLNITTRGLDDDGGRPKLIEPDSPDGFAAWSAALEAIADQGMKALMEAFNKSKKEHRDHLLKYAPAQWAALKTRAGKVKS